MAAVEAGAKAAAAGGKKRILYLHTTQAWCRVTTMKRKRVRLSDQIRRAVNASGVSRYRICKGIGLDQGTMSKFMAGHSGLSIATLDALADVLGLDVVARGPVNVPPPGRPGRKPKPRKGGKS